MLKFKKIMLKIQKILVPKKVLKKVKKYKKSVLKIQKILVLKIIII